MYLVPRLQNHWLDDFRDAEWMQVWCSRAGQAGQIESHWWVHINQTPRHAMHIRLPAVQNASLRTGPSLAQTEHAQAAAYHTRRSLEILASL